MYVWDNPLIIDNCMHLAESLFSIGLKPVFLTPTASSELLITKGGFKHVSLNTKMNECEGALVEWLERTKNTSFEMKEFKGVNLYRETEYERFCVFHGYPYPLSSNKTIGDLFNTTCLCIEAFSRIIDFYEPKACFVWNGLVLPPRALRTLCRISGIPVFSLERGLLPGFMVVDQKGINFCGSLGGSNWHVIEEQMLTRDNQAAEQYIHKFAVERVSVVNRGDMAEGTDIRSALDISLGKRVILIPNQIDSDTNIVYFSKKYSRNIDVIQAVLSATGQRNDVFVVVKTHPEDTDRDISSFERALGDRGKIVHDFHLHDLIDLADLVVVRNSTVGLEALLLAKSVVCLGSSSYSGKGFTYDVYNNEDLQRTINQILETMQPSIPNRTQFLFYLSYLLQGYHFKLSSEPLVDNYNRKFVMRLLDNYWSNEEILNGVNNKLSRRKQWGIKDQIEQIFIRQAAENIPIEIEEEYPRKSTLKIMAIIATYNEDDIIHHVIGSLVQNGINVYLIDNNSTDNTVAEASKWLNKGLIHIEKFPANCHSKKNNQDLYLWSDILRRKEELALSLNADWFIHHDADEFRESPWPQLSLYEAIRVVDNLGYNAIDFDLLNFRPTDNSYKPGSDVRQYIRHFECCEDFDRIQIKAWKKQLMRVDLQSSGGHEAKFEGRKVFPIKFVLRHYPIRSQAHGEKKVYHERRPRFDQRELDAGWHVQYNEIAAGHSFISDSTKLQEYNEAEEKLRIMGSCINAIAPADVWEKINLRDEYIRGLENRISQLEQEKSQLEQEMKQTYEARGYKLLSLYYNIRDTILARKESTFKR